MEAKSERQNDFSVGSIPKHVLRIGVPIIIAELVHVLYNIVDRIYIGHIPGEGTAALTGVGVAMPLITFIGAFSNLFGIGGAPLCSIARGEGDDEKATATMECAFTFLVATGLVITAIALLFREPLLRLAGADENSIWYAKEYFSVYAVGTVFSLISLGMNPYINSQGFAKVGMGTVLIGAVLNIVLDPLFIFTFGMGVRGAAVATVLSQIASALWVLRFLTGRKAILRLGRLRFDFSILGKIATLGTAGFLFRMTTSVTQALCNQTLLLWGGALAGTYVAGLSVVNSVREISMLPVSGISSGMQAVMSFNYGARCYDRVKETVRYAFLFALGYNLLIWGVIQLFPRVLTGIFTPDAELIALTVPCMRLFFVAYPCMTMQQIGQNSFVALNKPKFAVFFSIFRKLILIAPLTVLLPRLGLGPRGVFAAEAVSQAVGGSACFLTLCFAVLKKLPHARPDGAEG